MTESNGHDHGHSLSMVNKQQTEPAPPNVVAFIDAQYEYKAITLAEFAPKTSLITSGRINIEPSAITNTLNNYGRAGWFIAPNIGINGVILLCRKIVFREGGENDDYAPEAPEDPQSAVSDGSKQQ